MYKIQYFSGSGWVTHSTCGNMQSAIGTANRLAERKDAVRILEGASVVYCA